MRYQGHNDVALARAQASWHAWCLQAPPQLTEIAERWAELMDAWTRRGRQVRHVADFTLQQASHRRNLNAQDLRDVILVLYRCWQLGPSLRNWAKEKGYLRQTD